MTLYRSVMYDIVHVIIELLNIRVSTVSTVSYPTAYLVRAYRVARGAGQPPWKLSNRSDTSVLACPRMGPTPPRMLNTEGGSSIIQEVPRKTKTRIIVF